jgi:hypothetical protein
MATGYNATSIEEAKEAIIQYIVYGGDNEEAAILLPTLPVEEICNLYEFELEKSEQEFEQDFDF